METTYRTGLGRNLTALEVDNNFKAAQINQRGEGIINRMQMASNDEIGCHDSQILTYPKGDKTRLLVLYRTGSEYKLAVRGFTDNASLLNLTVATTVGWAPRMYKLVNGNIRIVYTKTRSAVFYKDFNITTDTLGTETAFQVNIKDGVGGYVATQALTLDVFLQHVANVSGIDYRDAAYDTFATRNILVEDTTQIQVVAGVYYLTIEVLADSMPNGDTGGIACLAWSNDLTVWNLNDPIRIGTVIDDQRDHEISATYIGGKWHALTRYNKLTFDNTSGYRYYTSVDGNTWTYEGLSTIPRGMKGIRHSVCKHTLMYASPAGANSNLSEKEVAIIMYQKTPSIDGIYGVVDTVHALRNELALVYTEDFVNFTEIASVKDRAMLFYPSITVLDDRLLMSWTSGLGKRALLGSIQWSSYNLSSI